MKIPFFHYTSLENLSNILTNGQLVSREGLKQKRMEFVDVSIDPTQTARQGLGLLNYIPLFPGFHGLYRSSELNRFLMDNYDDPKVCNKTFYGALNKTLQPKRGSSYEKIIILLVNNELVFKFADYGKIRFFTNIAIRSNSAEMIVRNRKDLEKWLTEGIEGENISGEIDLLDDGKISIGCTSDIEAIVVDNRKIRKQVIDIINKYETTGEKPSIFVSELPRDPIPPVISYRKSPTERQVAFAKYVEDLKDKLNKGIITPKEYRERIMSFQKRIN